MAAISAISANYPNGVNSVLIALINTFVLLLLITYLYYFA